MKIRPPSMAVVLGGFGIGADMSTASAQNLQRSQKGDNVKTIHSLLVAVVAGFWSQSVLAQARVLQPTRIEHTGGGFEVRSGDVDFYSNIAQGASNVAFYYAGVHFAGEQLFFEKKGINQAGLPVGPVGSPAKIRAITFFVYADDPNLDDGEPVWCDVTFDVYDHCVDYLPVGTACAPSGDDSVAQTLLGHVGIILAGGVAPRNRELSGYAFDITGLTFTVTDGNCFIDFRCWEYAECCCDVTTPSAAVFPAFNGPSAACAYLPGEYPTTGYSADNFYWDANGDGRYQRDELTFAGFANSPPYVSNLMIQLSGDDGCTMDLDGNGFVTADDIDYFLGLADGGCPN